MVDELLGKRVRVKNPHHPSTFWTGRAIAYADHPVFLIDTGGGRRMMLPAAWTTEDE